jgi:hypothetical protein
MSLLTSRTTFKRLRHTFVLKIGAMLLHGRFVHADSAILPPKGDKITKMTPLVTIGISKDISRNWAFSVELKHAFKTKAELPNLVLSDKYVMKRAVSISETGVNFAIVRRF